MVEMSERTLFLFWVVVVVSVLTDYTFAADIILIENVVSVYRCGSDTTMHVIGSALEVSDARRRM